MTTSCGVRPYFIYYPHLVGDRQTSLFSIGLQIDIVV